MNVCHSQSVRELPPAETDQGSDHPLMPSKPPREKKRNLEKSKMKTLKDLNMSKM